MNYKNRMFVLVSGALAIIIAFGTYVFGVTPLVELASDTETNLIQERSTLAIEQAKLSALSNTQNIEEIETRVSALTKAIPLELSDTTFYTTVNTIREQTGVLVSSITVGAGGSVAPDAAAGDGSALTGAQPYGVAIQGTGSRAQVLDFINTLQNAERLIRIDSVDFTGSEDGFSFSVAGEIYSIVLPTDEVDTDITATPEDGAAADTP